MKASLCPRSQGGLHDFSSIMDDYADALELWKHLDHFPDNQEVLRNLPIRNPLLWIK